MSTNTPSAIEKAINMVYDMPELKSCPIEATFKLIGRRWAALVLRELFRGEKQFNRFRDNIHGVTAKMLTLRLRDLEKEKLITRKIVSGYPIRVEYELTDRGRALAPILFQAAAFSMTQLPRTVFKDGLARDARDLLQNARKHS
jgi:DNA-binding HxlR family transcriptional regulator